MKTRRAVILVRNAMMAHQCEWGQAFAGGLRRHGWQAEIVSDYRPADLLVMWGVRHQGDIAEQRRRGGEVCIVERGYVGDRFKWSSVSFGGGLNGRGIYRGPHGDGSRWERHFGHLMQPWNCERSHNGYALVIGQVPGDSSIKGVDIEGFYRRAMTTYGQAARFRPHPHVKPADGAAKMEAARASLVEDLAGAACVVTWNSNTAVDAVLAGVPAVAVDQGSMAWAVTGHELGVQPPKPDRTAWAHWLAWTQWTREEIASGECWATVGAT
jgi:hypothetical protein